MASLATKRERSKKRNKKQKPTCFGLYLGKQQCFKCRSIKKCLIATSKK